MIELCQSESEALGWFCDFELDFDIFDENMHLIIATANVLDSARQVLQCWPQFFLGQIETKPANISKRLQAKKHLKLQVDWAPCFPCFPCFPDPTGHSKQRPRFKCDPEAGIALLQHCGGLDAQYPRWFRAGKSLEGSSPGRCSKLFALWTASCRRVWELNEWQMSAEWDSELDSLEQFPGPCPTTCLEKCCTRGELISQSSSNLAFPLAFPFQDTAHLACRKVQVLELQLQVDGAGWPCDWLVSVTLHLENLQEPERIPKNLKESQKNQISVFLKRIPAKFQKNPSFFLSLRAFSAALAGHLARLGFRSRWLGG